MIFSFNFFFFFDFFYLKELNKNHIKMDFHHEEIIKSIWLKMCVEFSPWLKKAALFSYIRTNLPGRILENFPLEESFRQLKPQAKDTWTKFGSHVIVLMIPPYI